MSFHRIEHTIDLLQKLSFFVFMVRYFLLSHFFVVENYQLSKSTSVSGMRQNAILIHLFFSSSIVSLMIFCLEIAIWADDAALKSACDIQSDLLQQVEMNCNLILKINFFWKIFLVFFGYFLILLCQDLVLKLSIQAQTLKAVIHN